MSSAGSSWTERLRSLWPYDDSPGVIDYPENDIRTHRWQALILKLMAAVVFFGGLWGTPRSASATVVGAICGTAALLFVVANQIEIQALRWELQLKEEEK